MNTEIIMALEETFPEPVTTETAIRDVKNAIEVVRNFGDSNALMSLADELDNLLLIISRSDEGTESARAKARQHSDLHGKVARHIFSIVDDIIESQSDDEE